MKDSCRLLAKGENIASQLAESRRTVEAHMTERSFNFTGHRSSRPLDSPLPTLERCESPPVPRLPVQNVNVVRDSYGCLSLESSRPQGWRAADS